MKTTVDIADSILKRAKKLAAQRGTTLKSLIEEALRNTLAAHNGDDAKAPVFHSVPGRGVHKGLAWSDLGKLIGPPTAISAASPSQPAIPCSAEPTR